MFPRYLSFIRDYFTFKKALKGTTSRFDIQWKKRSPILGEKTKTFKFDRHYVYHTAWAARTIHKINPTKHIDISSSLQFNVLVSAFVPVEFYDLRPANLQLDNFESKKADLYSLPFVNNSINSLSCMHVVEHVGLGRYGDHIDPDGDLKTISELQRVIAWKGSLLFVVPLGKKEIRFNAHRIYDYNQIIEYFNAFQLEEFAYIPENSSDRHIIYNPSIESIRKDNYGCGCFWFKNK